MLKIRLFFVFLCSFSVPQDIKASEENEMCEDYHHYKKRMLKNFEERNIKQMNDLYKSELKISRYGALEKTNTENYVFCEVLRDYLKKNIENDNDMVLNQFLVHVGAKEPNETYPDVQWTGTSNPNEGWCTHILSLSCMPFF